MTTPPERCAAVDSVTHLYQRASMAISQRSCDTCGGALPGSTMKHRTTILPGRSRIEAYGQHEVDSRLIAGPASIGQDTHVISVQIIEEPWPLAEEFGRLLHASLSTCGNEAILRARESL